MKFFKKYFSQIVTILFFSFLIWYFIGNREALHGLLDITWWVVVALLLLKASRIFITGLFTKFTLQAFDKKMSYQEGNYLSLLSSLGNFFGPILGGASIRAVYLKKVHNFEYSKFIATLYGFYIISFLTNALIGVLLILYFGSQQGLNSQLLSIFSVFLGIFTGNLLLVIIPGRMLHRLLSVFAFLPQRIISLFENMIEGWEIIRTNKPLLYKLFVLNLAIFSIIIVESSLLYSLFVVDWDVSVVILYAVLGTLSMLVSFTPGAIGIKEAIFLLANSVVALSSIQIVQIATVDRSVTFLLLFVSYLAVKLTRVDKRIFKDTN